ncbi:MAG: GNAT family N-acetyltransferase [Vicinamibacterales bacterium]
MDRRNDLASGKPTLQILRYARTGDEFRMTYRIRPATIADIPQIVAHREGMFRDMGTPTAFAAMATAFDAWLATAMPAGDYRGWVAVGSGDEVVAGAGVVIFLWPPGPLTMDGRCACVFNVYTQPAHRRQGLAKRMMESIHAWSRAQGIERMVLNASRDGHPIYKAMGYAEVDHPMMRLSL